MHEQAERLNKRLTEAGLAPVSFPPSMWPVPAIANPQPQQKPEQLNDSGDWLENWISSLELTFRGRVTQDPDDFLKRLTYRPSPSYPALAQRAGIHGFVILQVRLTKDGHVEVQKVLEGEPALADAAIDAVQRWRAKPARLNGKPCEVISTVKFDFQLPR
jgi:TonB family protein